MTHLPTTSCGDRPPAVRIRFDGVFQMAPPRTVPSNVDEGRDAQSRVAETEGMSAVGRFAMGQRSTALTPDSDPHR